MARKMRSRLFHQINGGILPVELGCEAACDPIWKSQRSSFTHQVVKTLDAIEALRANLFAPSAFPNKVKRQPS